VGAYTSKKFHLPLSSCVEWYALHTVFASGRGVDLNMDQNREANCSNLFSNLDLGAGTRPFNSGGAGNRGAHSGAYSTFWNLRANKPLQLPRLTSVHS
jgi:hypothetical protein